MATTSRASSIAAIPDRLRAGTTEADSVALLRELVAEVRALRRAIERQTPARSLTRGDRVHLAAILPAVAGVQGSELFTARELLEDDAPALRLVLAGLSAKQIGRLLHRAEGRAFDGYTVQRDGSEAGASLWRVLGHDNAQTGLSGIVTP
jgi:hypothetical protein